MTRPLPPPADQISLFFGLSYSSYFVMPRVIMEAMPADWQARFVALVEEAQGVWKCEDGPLAVDYVVQVRDKEGRFAHDPLSNYRHPDSRLLAKLRRRAA